jgi:TolB-like protein/Tfp pilus assembly protein PilF
MFTDMVGYTALMQKDEQKAKSYRDRHRRVLEQSIEGHQGKIIQYYGDGTLSIFASGVVAVQAATEIQQELLQEPVIPLRIGIHIGDIVYDDEGVYGDGVNVTSRIESLSVPGAVLISDKLQDELSSHPEFTTKSLGKFNLKNVKRPIEIFAVKAENLKIPTSKELKIKKIDSSKSIAVLPFLNMSADPENEYFSDGITEEILNALTKLDGLQVTSRTSSFAFKGKDQDVRSIGNQLGVNTVLEGSVRKAGNKVRITAQLINSSDGYHIWSEVYDRKLEDIFEVQDEISSKIANTLREKLTGKEKKEQLISSPTKNIDAYNLFLKGRYNLNKWTPDGAKKGIEYFKDAIKLEPDFALPYSSIAFCYTMMAAMGQMSPQNAYKKAKENAQKSMELDDKLADAYVSLGLIKIFNEWDLKGAKKLFQTALTLKPGDCGIHHANYVYLGAVGKLDEALEEVKLAVQLDPLSLPINTSLAEAYMHLKEYDKAIEQLNKTLELDPTFRAALHSKGWAYFYRGDVDKSIETFMKYYNLLDDPLKGITGLGYVYAKSGRTEEANECINKMKEREKRDKDISLNADFALIYTGLEDYDKVFYYLEKSFEEGNSAYFFRISPLGEDVVKDPRFKELNKKYGFE